MVMRSAFTWLAAAWFAMVLGGCSTGHYYWQAVTGHLSILRKREPISRMRSSLKTEDPLRAKLQLVLELRDYAGRRLDLPPTHHYLQYADLHRRYVVWNVNAAPEFSLKAKTWWYPVVGRLKYRGFYHEQDAERLADKLSQNGMDVYVGGVEAYSTLDWFPDIVLNTFIHRQPTDLAELLFHELTHQRVFVSGDTDFNEALATAVSQAGVRHWCRETGRVRELAVYEQSLVKERRFAQMIQEARAELEKVYSSESFPNNESRREAKTKVLQKLQASYQTARGEWVGASPYEGWFSRNLNNAQLNSVATYLDLVPAFEKLLDRSGGVGPGFFRQARAIGKLPQEKRVPELLAH